MACERKNHSIAVCYEYIEKAIANPPTPHFSGRQKPDFTSTFRGKSDIAGHADGFVSVENGSKPHLIRHRVSHSGHRGIRKNSGAGRRVFPDRN